MTEAEEFVLEVERLRRAVDVGFATSRGELALLLQRADQIDKTLDEHEARIEALERTRWPLPSLAAATSCLALALTVWQTLGR